MEQIKPQPEATTIADSIGERAAAARLRYIAGTAWSAKCYMNMRPLYQPQVTQTEAVA